MQHVRKRSEEEDVMVEGDKEKDRKLSEAEQKRLERFEDMAAGLVAQGWRRTDLTIGIVKANVVTFAVGIPVFIVCIVLFALVNQDADFRIGIGGFLIFVVSYVVLIVVHEFIHGLTWSFFAEHGFKDIEFGFMKEYMTPYCTCGVPLAKGPYILGALMPLIVLGIVPIIVAFVIKSALLLYIGAIMAISAGGDIMIVAKLLAYRSTASEIMYCDHPTQAGGVIFER